MHKMSFFSQLMAAFLVLLVIVLGFLQPETGFKGTGLALLPPALAIIMALLTKEVYSSLFFGLITGALFVGKYHPLTTFDTMMNDGFLNAIKETAGIFFFLVILGALVALINRTGATVKFGKWAQTHIKSRSGAQLATFLLGILIFIDDYFNCLTVGCVMRPVTDANRISRAKLSYLIDATAAPVCMIAPISSWAAAVSSYAKEGEVTGIELFIKAIPFNFYSLLTFIFIILLAVLKIDYGPMALHEKNAIENNDLFTNGQEQNLDESKVISKDNASVLDLLFPVLLLIVSCVLALIYAGGILNEGIDFVKAFSETDATIALPLGGLIAFCLAVIYLIVRKTITFQEAMSAIPEGFKAMVPAITILTFAVSLKNMTSALEAREFIGDFMQNHAASLGNFLPAIIFLVACLLAFATGTSWGTFGILIPIVTAIFIKPGDPLLIIGMSACLAGSVCGDHCSPISDTTIMSSAGARCEHLNHVSTQLPYAITVAVFSFIGFMLAGFCPVWSIVFPVTTILMIAFLLLMKKRQMARN